MIRNILLLLFTLTVGFTTYADEYIPLVREGIKWICYETKFESSSDFSEEIVDTRFYTIEFRGDSVIDGITYKKCYRYSDVEWDENFVIPCSKTKPFALLREEDRVIYAYSTNYSIFEYSMYDFSYWSYDDWQTSGSKEVKLYQFKENDFFKFEGYIPFLNQDSEVFYFDDEYGSGYGVFIEGIGFDSDIYGDLLTPFYHWAFSMGFFYSYIGLHHIEDADGNIIYYGKAYKSCDLNGDGITDVTDLSILINSILSYNYCREYDMNIDMILNVEDVNILINKILKLE